MPRFPSFRLLLAMALVAIAASRHSARADLMTDLSVSTMPVSGGLTQYDYTLADLSTSTVTASSFFVVVDGTANLSALSAPTGWDISYYTPGDTAVGFTSPDPSLDIVPGSSGMFSFQSLLTPVLVPYEVAGIDANNNYVVNTGVIFSAAIVPEPSSAVLCTLGILGALSFHRRLRRKPSASVPR
jgi:hypothetical protein